jgi:hypothetical protein
VSIDSDKAKIAVPGTMDAAALRADGRIGRTAVPGIRVAVVDLGERCTAFT